MPGSSLCLWDTKRLFPLDRWGQCWLNDLPKSSGVSGRTVLCACLIIGSSPWHEYQLNTVFSISYEQCHLNFHDFMQLGSFIFFQFYNNVLCWVCDGSHLLSCKQMHFGSKQGRNDSFCPQNHRDTKSTASKSLQLKWNTFNSSSLPLLFLTWLHTGFINLLWILDSCCKS